MNFIINFIKGIFVGVANIIPGVSGGTMAVSFGIYDKILSSISNLFKDFKNSVKALLPIFVGMAAGIVGFTFIIPYCLKTQPFITSMAFTGLIIGGLPAIAKSLKETISKEKPSYLSSIIVFIFMLTIALAMPFINANSESGVLLNPDGKTIITVFFMGIIAAATMVIPGVSGSLILMILGYYFGIISAVKDFITALKDLDFAKMFNLALILAPFALGCILGIFFISKLIAWLLKVFPTQTFSGILGLIIVSPVSIFYKVNEEYSMTNTSIAKILIGVILLVLCIIVTLYIGNLDTNKEENN
ncbi:MAG: DUF368 domain-containing protein [Lachnospiraceae bacterium]|nr:DUF368 domain-containing protein [Lachnospiraceae bacterium]